jgi:hypothetical protein
MGLWEKNYKMGNRRGTMMYNKKWTKHKEFFMSEYGDLYGVAFLLLSGFLGLVLLYRKL